MTRFLQGAAFRLQDQNGKLHSLSDYKGTWVVLDKQLMGQVAPPKAS